MSVLIETTIGDLVFDLYIDKRPKSCLNFLKLCKIKYYNFCLFHSIRRNFIAQCGDPTGTGRGGESVFGKMYGEQAKYFELEIKPKIKHQSKGTISFVNNGNNMHGSQFFITLGDGLDFLDGKHTVFGKLTEGFETLEKLNETICDESHRAYQDVRISHTIVLDDPFDDPKGLVIPEKSPEPTQEQLDSGRIRADEDLEAEKAKPKELIEKEIEDKELKIGTKILETIGDIGDAEEKPPENVLFVCKLNHVTNEEDLKIIFSRFGKILSCEIIKDQKTGDSLCYGFIEFKEVESCERAYFKMDNVLIDDRRIHVDFCQSLAKIKKFHKNAMQKFSNKDDNSQGYKIKHSKAEDKKYSMIFDDESSKKSKTNKPLYKPRSKRDYSSESDSDSDNTKKKKKLPVKPKVKRKSSTSSSDDHRSPSPKPKKKFRRRSDSSMERISGKSSKNKTKLDEKKPARKSYDRRDYSSGDDELIRRPAKKKFNESFNKNKKSVDEDRRTSKSRRRSRSRESNRSPSRGKRRNRSTSLDNKRNYSADRKKKTQASKAQQKKRAPSSDSDSDSEPREEKLDKKRQSLGGDQKDKKSIRSWDDDSYAQKGQSRRGYSSEEDAKHTKDSMKKSLSKADTRKSRLSDDDLDDTHRGSEKTSSRVLKTQSASKKKPSVDTSGMDYSDYDSDHGGHRDSTKKQKQKSRDTPPPIPKVPGRKSTDRNNKKDRGGRYSDDYSSSDNEKKFNNKKETPGKVPFSDDDEATAVRRGKATTTTKKQTTKTKERIGDFPNSPKSASRKKTPRSIRRKPTYSDQSYSEEEKSSYKGQKKGSALSSVTKTKKKSRDDRSDTEDYAKSSSKKTTTKRRRDSSSSDESFSKRRHSSSDDKSKSKRRCASPPPKNLSRARKYSSSEDDASRRKLQRSKKTRRRSSSRSVSTSD